MNTFDDIRRQGFRRYYQPTRIVFGIVAGPQPSGVNLITLCFTASCSYKPAMMMFAIQKHTLSFDLFQRSNECVLSVPGESLAAEALYCGTTSGRDTDKLAECGLAVVGSKTIRVPGLQAAIANLEVEILHRVTTGDHLTVMGLVKRFAVARGNRERNLLSVGPQHDGYLVLLKNGIHRIGVVETETAEPNSAFRAHNKYVALLRKRDSREE